LVGNGDCGELVCSGKKPLPAMHTRLVGNAFCLGSSLRPVGGAGAIHAGKVGKKSAEKESTGKHVCGAEYSRLARDLELI